MALLEQLSFECASHSDEQTQRLGMRLGALLPRRAVVALHGPLGAGKTSFARGVGRGWGAEQLLRSPTFTLVQEHHREKTMPRCITSTCIALNTSATWPAWAWMKFWTMTMRWC